MRGLPGWVIMRLPGWVGLPGCELRSNAASGLGGRKLTFVLDTSPHTQRLLLSFVSIRRSQPEVSWPAKLIVF
jgi:hypothetical protein